MFKRVVLALLVVGGFSAEAEGQAARGPWLLRLEGGYTRLHEHGGGALALSGHLGRRLGELVIADLRLTQGTQPRDTYTALEVALELRVPVTARLAVFAGGGAGLMAEGNFSSLGLPFFANGGVEWDLDTRSRLRASVRRGSHASSGDSGTFRGPHVVSLGWVRDF